MCVFELESDIIFFKQEMLVTTATVFCTTAISLSVCKLESKSGLCCLIVISVLSVINWQEAYLSINHICMLLLNNSTIRSEADSLFDWISSLSPIARLGLRSITNSIAPSLGNRKTEISDTTSRQYYIVLL